MWLAFLLLLFSRAVHSACDVSEQELVTGMNSMIDHTEGFLNKVAGNSTAFNSTFPSWVYLSNEEVPRLGLLGDHPAGKLRGTCITLDGLVAAWLAKVGVLAVSEPDDGTRNKFVQLIETLTDAFENLLKKDPLLPSKLGDFALNHLEKERIRRWTPVHPLRNPENTTRVMHPAYARRMENPRLWKKPGALLFNRSREIWPSYTNRGVLVSRLNSRSIPACREEELYRVPGRGMRAVNISYVDFADSLSLYETTLGINGFEQLRHYCYHPSGNSSIMIVTQMPNGIPLSEFVRARRRSSSPVFKGGWERLLALRLRQALELVSYLGWVHTEPSAERIVFDTETGAAVLTDLYLCKQGKPMGSRLGQTASLQNQLLQFGAFIAHKDTFQGFKETMPSGERMFFSRLHASLK